MRLTHLITVLAVAPACAALAQTTPQPIVSNVASDGGQSSGFVGPADGSTIGFQFTSDVDQQIVSLGVWSDADNSVPANVGLDYPHDVGLWDADGTLLAQAVVGPDDPILGQYHYADLDSPVPLVAGGQYVLGAVYISSGGDQYRLNPTVTLSNISDTFARFNSGTAFAPPSGFAFPAMVQSGNSGRFGPNALAVIPEPAGAALLAAGGLAALGRRRRG